jgi:hypothetical protein
MPLKIILLLDSYTLQAWQFELVKSLKESGYAQLVACVINQTPKLSGKKSLLVYRTYRWCDRKLFSTHPDAFAQKSIQEILNWNVPALEVSPIQKKYSDFFEKSDLERIKSYQPDLIIRLGFRILTGGILTLPRLGVWSFHHGDPDYYRGGPPAFWEVMNAKPITGVVLQQLTEKLDQGKVLYSSFSQTDPLSVDRNANRIFWKSAFFPLRVIQQIELIGEEAWLNSLEQQSPEGNPVSPLLRPPSTLSILFLLGDLVSRNVVRKIKALTKKPHWEIGYIKQNEFDWNTNTVPKNPILLPVAEPNTSYLADPFPVEYGGDTFLFYEDFDKKTQKGRIGCGKLTETGLSNQKLVLEEDWHLSYPFSFEQDGEHFLIPESADNGKIYRYRAKNFPYEWEKGEVFFPFEGYDPTILRYDNKYWLFINQRLHPGISPFDELFLYWCTDFLDPVWHAHPLNPIVSDVRFSRPAGAIFWEGKRPIRPAQDSGLRYGHQVIFREIIKLTETEYQEETVGFLSAAGVKGALGVHTFNQAAGKVFLDFYYRR